MRSAIETTFGEYHIESDAIDAGDMRCAECHDVGPGDKLFIYSSVRGRRARAHDGAFCSLDCHDRYYGLKRR